MGRAQQTLSRISVGSLVGKAKHHFRSETVIEPSKVGQFLFLGQDGKNHIGLAVMTASGHLVLADDFGDTPGHIKQVIEIVIPVAVKAVKRELTGTIYLWVPEDLPQNHSMWEVSQSESEVKYYSVTVEDYPALEDAVKRLRKYVKCF
jgi:hypothetical protein